MQSTPIIVPDTEDEAPAATVKKLSGAQLRQLLKRRGPTAPQTLVKRGRVKADGSNA